MLNQCQWWAHDEVHALAQQRLAGLLRHSWERVPYYREVLSASGVVEGSGSPNLERFTKVPFLSKETMRSRQEELRSEDLESREWQYNTSGGSTGEPIRFIQDAHYKDWGVAVTGLFDQWSQYTVGSRRVVLWGSERDLFADGEPWNVKAGRWIRNEVWLNAFRMAPDRMREYVETINRFRPVQLLAYADSVYELARFIERERLEVRSPTAVMTIGRDPLSPHAERD